MFSARKVLVLAMVLIVLTVLPGTGVLTSQAAAVDQDPRSFVASYFAAIDQALMPLGPSASLRGKYDLMSQSGQSLASYQAATAASFQHWIAAHGDTYHAISTELANMSVVQSINAATIDVRATTTMIWTPNLVPPPDGFSAEKAASMAEMKSVG